MITLSDLQYRIAAVRRKERRVVFFEGFFKSAVALVAALLTYFLLDWLSDLPYAARLVFAGAGAGFVLYVVYRYLVRELRRIEDDDEIALRVEGRNPELHGRLISTLQLTRVSKTGIYAGSPELIAALEAETVRMSEPLDFFRIISTEMLARFGIAAAVIVAINTALFVKFPEDFRALGARLVKPNAHYPTKTRIIRIKSSGGGFEEKLFPPEDDAALVPRGEELQIEVTVDEREIPSANPDNVLNFKSLARGTITPIELAPMGGPIFKGTLSKALEDMELTVRLGDARSDPLKVRVLTRPEVDVAGSGDCIRYTYPEYTHETNVPPERFGGLSALAGSVALMRFIPTKPLASAHLERNDGTVLSFEKKIETRVVPATEKAPAATETVEWWELPKLPVDKNGSFHVNLKDVDGLTNSQPPVEYPIEARPDLPPTIKLQKPTRDLTVTPVAKLNVTFQARDDWGLRTVWLVYRVQTEGQGESSAEVKRIEREVPHEKSPAPVTFTWDLGALTVKPGDQIVFWMEADDCCDANDFMPVPRSRHTSNGTGVAAPGPEAQTPPQKSFPRSSDVKLTVVSREDKILELQAEVERLYQQIVHAKENQEELKSKVRILLEELLQLKGGGN